MKRKRKNIILTNFGMVVMAAVAVFIICFLGVML